jgi:predicted dehydrogenase
MNLSPEEKQIGKNNFYEAVGTTRRDFLKKSIATTVAAGSVSALGGYYFNYDKINEPLRVGIIGTGDEGGVLIGALNPEYIDVVAIADIRPYSLHRAFYGDWYSDGARAARPGLLEVYKKEGWVDRSAAEKHITVHKDQDNGYQKLLDDPRVEAVIIALPLHLHHQAAVAAMRAGKHVLTEKLMGHDVAQCKEMGRVAASTGKVFGVGHQRHYSILYDNAVNQIKQGLIGDLHHIRAQWHRGNLPGNDSWQPPLPEAKDYAYDQFNRDLSALGVDNAAKQKLAQAHPLYSQLRSWKGKLADAMKNGPAKDIDMWNKRISQTEAQLADVELDAAKYLYETKQLPMRTRTALEELIRWRLWNRTGGGLMAELGSHQLDAASIFIAADPRSDGHKVRPLSVVGIGGRHIFPPDRDCDDHVYCTYEFPAPGYWEDEKTGKVADPNKKIVVTYSSINGNGFGGWGEVVFGTKGTLILEQEQDAMLFQGGNTTTRVGVKATGPGKSAMDTYETGGGGAALAQAATKENTSRGYKEEIEHWAWCIRNPDPAHQPRCKPEVAMADAIIALTSNIAIAKGGRIDFDPAWFDINNDTTPEGTRPRQADQIA